MSQPTTPKSLFWKLSTVVWLLLLMLPDTAVRALDIIPDPGNTGNNATRPTQYQPGGRDLNEIITSILSVVVRYLAVLGAVILLMVVYQGIRYMTARDNPQAAAQVRTALAQLLIAGGILTAAGFLVSVLWAIAAAIGNAAATGT